MEMKPKSVALLLYLAILPITALRREYCSHLV